MTCHDMIMTITVPLEGNQWPMELWYHTTKTYRPYSFMA